MNRNVIGERNRGGDGLVRWQYKKHFGSMYYQGLGGGCQGRGGDGGVNREMGRRLSLLRCRVVLCAMLRGKFWRDSRNVCQLDGTFVSR